MPPKKLVFFTTNTSLHAAKKAGSFQVLFRTQELSLESHTIYHIADCRWMQMFRSSCVSLASSAETMFFLVFSFFPNRCSSKSFLSY